METPSVTVSLPDGVVSLGSLSRGTDRCQWRSAIPDIGFVQSSECVGGSGREAGGESAEETEATNCDVLLLQEDGDRTEKKVKRMRAKQERTVATVRDTPGRGETPNISSSSPDESVAPTSTPVDRESNLQEGRRVDETETVQANERVERNEEKEKLESNVISATDQRKV